MRQSMGSQRVRHDLASEQQNVYVRICVYMCISLYTYLNLYLLVWKTMGSQQYHQFQSKIKIEFLPLHICSSFLYK